MKCKYGSYDNNQFIECKKRMHSLIHWLLIYAEEERNKTSKDVDMKKYFEKVQYKINGYNELLLCPPQLIEIQALIEAAYLEYFGETYNHETYRKIILDAHDLIDKIPVGD